MADKAKQFPLDGWDKGEPIAASKLNQVVEAVKYIQRGIRAPQQIIPNGNASAIQVQQFQIYAINDDTLACNPYDGVTADASQVVIGKPGLLRRSQTARNGIAYTYTTNQARTATSGATTETQAVVPSYVVGDVIFAMKLTSPDGLLFDGQPVVWVDINVDGRAWAQVGGGSGTVTSVTGVGPITSTGGATPIIGINAFTGDSGSGGAKGAVPAPASGDAVAKKYLFADGTWRAITASDLAFLAAIASSGSATDLTTGTIPTARFPAFTGDVTTTAGGVVNVIGAGKVTNAMLAGSIAYSKLVLSGAILNTDLAGSIAYSKLSLTGAILNTDLAGSIAYSKLSLTGAILNADLAGSIANSKLANMAANTIKGNNTAGSTTPSDLTVAQLVAMLLSGLTSGDMLFVNSGALGTDANLFWDSINHRLGIGNAAPKCAQDVTGTVRVIGIGVPATGQGVETSYSGTRGSVIAYDRTGSAYLPLDIAGADVTINNGVGGNVGINKAPTSGFKLDVSGNIRTDTQFYGLDLVTTNSFTSNFTVPSGSTLNHPFLDIGSGKTIDGSGNVFAGGRISGAGVLAVTGRVAS